MADTREERDELQKKKAFRWSSEMIQNLINCLMTYKARMEYNAIDFDGDRPAQYKKLRKEMAKLYEIEDVSLFGPVALSTPSCSLEDMSDKEKKDFLLNQKKETSQIQKGHQRIQEKVKDIRQNFSKAVTAGTRSGSGKIVYEYYDELVRIWGGYPSTEPLSFGIDTDCIIHEQLTHEKVTNNDTSKAVDGNHEKENLLETGNDQGKESTGSAKRKSQNLVPKLIDNKRKHLEKTLSAAQRDKMLLDEVKEDYKFRKELSDCMSRSTLSFTNAMESMNSTLVQLGKSICQSVEMLSQAMLAQQQQQPQKQLRQHPGGINHNVFYQNQNMYQPMGIPPVAYLPNNGTQDGMQQNLTNLTPPVQKQYPGPSSNEQQKYY